MSETTKRVFFPATRFHPDTNEQGHVLRDKRGDFKSGTFELTIFESVKEASVFVASHTENVTFNKYNVIREEIEPLTVPELVDYFKLNDQFDKYMGVDKSEKEAAPKSVEAPRQTDGESGTQTTEQKGQSSDKNTAEDK